MKSIVKRALSFGLMLCLTAALCIPAFAESYTANQGTVTFNGTKMVENYPNQNLQSNIQPGDDLTQVIEVKNSSAVTTYWYIRNEVLKSLEDLSKRKAHGGGYSYSLVYSGPDGDRELYNSSRVGGETSSNMGMAEATLGLQDYVYLGELAPGAGGKVTLKMAVDGRSQINVYQDTDAKVSMQFAVETKEGKTIIVPPPKTGDWMKTLPFIVLTAFSGLLLLGMAILWSSQPKKKKAKGGR